jgi:signal transduction histidine kinase
MNRETFRGFSIVVTDLTDRKAAEEQLRISNARLKELVAELEHFSYTISHDMRAPLRAMKSFAMILQEDYATCSREENREILERIGTAAGRMDSLISSSLQYAKVLAENPPTEPVDLGRLIRGLLQTYPNLLPEKADIEVAPELPIVMGNEAALTQCFSNLLANAVKFVSAGTRPSVRVWAEPSGAMVRIWIEDNGIGIAPSDQGRIFDMFFRAARGGYDGTGMGLALARKVVTRLGGRIGVESQEGVGSRFWIELNPA